MAGEFLSVLQSALPSCPDQRITRSHATERQYARLSLTALRQHFRVHRLKTPVSEGFVGAIEGIQHTLSTGSVPCYRVHPAANARSFPLTVTRPRPPPWVHYGRRIEPVDSAR